MRAFPQHDPAQLVPDNNRARDAPDDGLHFFRLRLEEEGQTRSDAVLRHRARSLLRLAAQHASEPALPHRELVERAQQRVPEGVQVGLLQLNVVGLGRAREVREGHEPDERKGRAVNSSSFSFSAQTA